MAPGAPSGVGASAAGHGTHDKLSAGEQEREPTGGSQPLILNPGPRRSRFLNVCTLCTRYCECMNRCLLLLTNLKMILLMGSFPLLLLEIGSCHSGLGCCQVSLGTKYRKLYIFGTSKFLNFQRGELYHDLNFNFTFLQLFLNPCENLSKY